MFKAVCCCNWNMELKAFLFLLVSSTMLQEETPSCMPQQSWVWLLSMKMHLKPVVQRVMLVLAWMQRYAKFVAVDKH